MYIHIYRNLATADLRPARAAPDDRRACAARTSRWPTFFQLAPIPTTGEPAPRGPRGGLAQEGAKAWGGGLGGARGAADDAAQAAEQQLPRLGVRQGRRRRRRTCPEGTEVPPARSCSRGRGEAPARGGGSPARGGLAPGKHSAEACPRPLRPRASGQLRQRPDHGR